MVFYRERDNERPPVSLILPHLYLGAESDVTQDCLSARGISYVLSVSRCSPQPAFLPHSQYLRIPIDDSLRDDLLPWIPEALRFIDGAMSCGGSVLVHCAAGISRSPALAVAYIMYSLCMDLDHAYRFVKERRPSISPNFNFLGQLQHFQGTLRDRATNGHAIIQPLLESASENNNCCSTSPSSVNDQCNALISVPPGAGNTCVENCLLSADKVEPNISNQAETGKATVLSANQQEKRGPPPQTRSLSGKLRTLTLALNQSQIDAPTPCEVPLGIHIPVKPAPKPTDLPIPASFASLSEKRKSLTLSLSPLGTTAPQQRTPPCENANDASQLGRSGITKVVHKREQRVEFEVNRHVKKPSAGVSSSVLAEEERREMSSSGVTSTKTTHSPSQSNTREREGRGRGKKGGDIGRERSRGKARTQTGSVRGMRSTVVDQQPVPESKLTTSASEAQECLAEQQGALSPLNLTVNKLLGWGERMLMGVLLGPRIKVGQVALPYRC